MVSASILPPQLVHGSHTWRYVTKNQTKTYCKFNHLTKFWTFILIRLDAIENGSKQYGEDSSSPVFGAIIEYSCDAGFELDGVASVVCTENDWSAPEPTCRVLECAFDYFTSLVRILNKFTLILIEQIFCTGVHVPYV